MTRVVKFLPVHLKMFEHLSVHTEPLKQIQEFDGHAFTIVRNGEVLGCIGGVELWPGVLEVWARLSTSITRYSFSVVKAIIILLEESVDVLGLHRIQAYAKAECPHLARWFETFGFSNEGLLKAFGEDRSDYFLMARVFG